jgi:hypothetical protein
MKKIILNLLVFAGLTAFSQSTPISGLPSATTITGTEIAPIVQGGVTKKVILSNIPITGKIATTPSTALTGSGTAASPYTINVASGSTPTLTAISGITVTGSNPYSLTATPATSITAGSGATVTQSGQSFTIAASGGSGSVSLPAGEIGYGTGSSITSTSALTYTNNGLVVPNLSVTGQYNKLLVNSGGVYSQGLNSLSDNTAYGFNSLMSTTSGNGNTAYGRSSLMAATTGGQNTGIGDYALSDNLVGNDNVAVGYATLDQATGNNNTAVGSQALLRCVGGTHNTAAGFLSLENLTSGSYNLANGVLSGQNLTNANFNVLLGYAAGQDNISGDLNTLIGYESGDGITTGTGNTIIGRAGAVGNISNNVILADGASNIRYRNDATNNNFYQPVIAPSYSSSSTSTLNGLVIPTATAGYVWTATNTAGAGTWSTVPSSGGGATLTAGANVTVTGSNPYTVAVTPSLAVTTISTSGTSTVANLVLPSTGTITGYVNRISSVTTQSAVPQISTDRIHFTTITGLAQAITSVTMTGTPFDGQLFEIRITDNGTARAITWGSQFAGSLLPTTTVISTRLRVFLEWDAATSKWFCVGSL